MPRWLTSVYADATAALQALNPIRLTHSARAKGAGATPNSPRLRANMLVHRLSSHRRAGAAA
ncbi:hypothetical protein ACFQ1L_26560 [Phytohabitans flavus]|uniref:hypothetical protein n=1 Tax=Phytohabitans flavus TaxID=1076124 RepID=UPI0036456B7F